MFTTKPVSKWALYVSCLFIFHSLSIAQERVVGFTPVDVAPTVDGIKDGAYLKTFAIDVQPTGTTAPDDEADLSGTYSGIYTESGLYLFVEVMDADLIVDSGEQFWRDDSLEIYLDGDNSDSGSFDGKNDVKFAVQLMGDGSAEFFGLEGSPTPKPASADFSGLEHAYFETAGTGYAVEVYIPWEAVGLQPFGSWQMGLDFQINDDDDGDGRDTHLALSSENGGNNHTEEFATAELWGEKHAIIAPKPSGLITVDGIMEGIYEDGPINIASGRPGDSPAPAPMETSISWRALYDDNFLYLFFNIQDSELIMDSAENQSWHDDSLELVFDGNNSDIDGYAGSSDIVTKITFVPQSDGSVRIITLDNYPPPPAGADFTDLEAAYIETDSGWALEAKIPFTAYQITPEAGDEVGIDFQLNDDDDGGERDYNLTWSSGTGVNNRTDLWGRGLFFKVKETTIYPATTDIIMDGEIDDEWDLAIWNVLDTHYGEWEPTTRENLSGKWAAVYDDDFVYFIVDVIDNDLSWDSDTPWNDDGLETGIDPSNDSPGAYDNVEDFKVDVSPGYDDPVRIGGFPPAPSDINAEGLDGTWIETELGWRTEYRIPMTAFRKEAPHAGDKFAYEIELNDDDFGGGRDRVLFWSSHLRINFSAHKYGIVNFGAGSAEFAAAISARLVEGDLHESSWFGQFTEPRDENNWIVHEGLGWLYTAEVSAGSQAMWLYSTSIEGWVYADSNVFPYLYSFEHGWTYYIHYAEGVAYLYVFDSEAWIAL